MVALAKSGETGLSRPRRDLEGPTSEPARLPPSPDPSRAGNTRRTRPKVIWHIVGVGRRYGEDGTRDIFHRKVRMMDELS